MKKTGLFKIEVYQAMQSTLGRSSKFRGAEEFFEMFYADRQLQDFLRAYATKEGIIESISKYRAYPKNTLFTQAGEDRQILLVDNSKWESHECGEPFGVEKSGVYIGPRQDRDAALMIYAHLGEIVSDQSTGLVAGEVIKDRIWKIKVRTYFFGYPQDSKAFDGKSYPVSQASLFRRISKKDMLNGLERAVKKLIR